MSNPAPSVRSPRTGRPTTPAAAQSGADPGTPRPSNLVGPEVRFAAAGTVALGVFIGTYVAFVTTETGQRIENLALRGAELRTPAEQQASEDVLSLVTLALFTLTVAGVFLVGLAFQRARLGSIAAATMVLSLVIAEVVKDVIERPELAPGPAWLLRNSYPSGTATAATAMAVGVFLVAPNRLRWLVLPAGALFAALVGHSVQASGWHRLSDTIAATTLVIGIACMGVVLLARAGMVQRSDGGLIDPRVSHLLLVGSGGLLVVAITLLALPTAFPLLAGLDRARRAFLQAAFPLVGASVTLFMLTVFGLLVQPFGLGSGKGRLGHGGGSVRREPAGAEARATGSEGALPADGSAVPDSLHRPPVVPRRDR